MEILMDGVIAFLSAVGLTALLWLLSGRLCRRERSGAVLLLPVRGDGNALAEELDRLAALRLQLRCCAPLVMADCGLDEMGRRRARALTERYEGALLLPAEELTHYLTQ